MKALAMKNRALTIGFFVLLLSVLAYSAGGTSASTVAVQGAQDFTLHNETGIEITQLFVAPHSPDPWTDEDVDILGVDTLPDGKSAHITFSPKTQAALWDIKIVDTNGNIVEWDEFNLLEISEITLYYKDGKPTAEYK